MFTETCLPISTEIASKLKYQRPTPMPSHSIQRGDPGPHGPANRIGQL
jgi:hypothetical protein